jgi:hypothetical protein
LVQACLLGGLDLILRCVCEVDDWFGRINLIFAGDFFQLPPVSATPLCRRISTFSKDGRSGEEARWRDGRIVWKQIKTVIELTGRGCEPGIWRNRSALASARGLDRCRCRFIRRLDVINSHDNPNGADLADKRFESMVAIVEWSKTRRPSIQLRPLQLPQALMRPFSCQDTKEDPMSLKKSTRSVAVTAVRILPAELHLYIGAPIILKCRQIRRPRHCRIS